MAIAVVDGQGGLQLFRRMDGTLPVSTELAASKAYTAAILRMTSAEVGKLALQARRFTESKVPTKEGSFFSVGDFLCAWGEKSSGQSVSAVAALNKTSA